MRFFYEKRYGELQFSVPPSLAFAAHIHDDIEIIYLAKGRAHAFSGGVDVTLEAGDFFVVFPQYVHYYDNCENTYAMVAVIPVEMLPEFRNVFTKKAPVSPIVRDADPQDL